MKHKMGKSGGLLVKMGCIMIYFVLFFLQVDRWENGCRIHQIRGHLFSLELLLWLHSIRLCVWRGA